MRMTYCIPVVFKAIILLGACGGGGGSDVNGENTTVNVEAVPFVAPSDAASLQAALYTRYASADDFDVWLCTPQGSPIPTEAYSLPAPDNAGVDRFGTLFDLTTGGEVTFSWQALSATELRTTDPNTSMEFFSSNYQFSSRSSFSYEQNGVRFCNLVDNAVAFGGAPVEPSAPVEPTINGQGNSALAALNARIPAANRPVSAVLGEEFVSSFNGTIFINSVEPRFIMTFPNGYSTDCHRWDIVADSPTPESIGDRCGDLTTEQQEDTPLRGFAPGETLNISFGSLTTSVFLTGGGFINSGDLILTSDGRIALGSRGFSSISAGDVTVTGNSQSNETGRYYLNGYTITVQMDSGEVFHKHIGALSDTALMLGNTFYSEGLAD